MEVRHWKKQLFTVPWGNAGTAFIAELSRLYRAYAEGSTLEVIAMKAVAIMPGLLLQKPYARSKPKEHKNCLERRLKLWKEGDFKALLEEGRTIQQHHKKRQVHRKNDTSAMQFANRMFEGDVKGALRLLPDDKQGGILHPEATINHCNGTSMTVLEALKSKHPPGESVTESALLPESSDSTPIHPVSFDRVDASSIRSAVLRTTGSAGPSGMDAKGWRRICTSFKGASDDLCHALALMGRRLATSYVDPVGLAPFLACRLIALDKNPGVRPIGICEIVRRIIAKTILSMTSADIQDVAGSLQLCAGQPAGVEAVVHAMKESFESNDTEAVLLVDATNAFNSLNRKVALHNVRQLCPCASTFIDPTQTSSLVM